MSVLFLYIIGVLSSIIPSILSLHFNRDPDLVKFYFFFSRRDIYACEELKYNPTSSTPPHGFSIVGPTRFIIHGYGVNSFHNESIAKLKNEFLKSAEPGNVIMVDWSEMNKVEGLDTMSGGNGFIIAYPFIAKNLPVVAGRVTQFILNYYTLKLLDPEHVHGIGHSMGAHIMGSVGDAVKSAVGIPIARITSLDPAGPLFWPPFFSIERSLRKSDAIFVDVIHSNAGGFGQSLQSGHADFYPNGGTKQPGCDVGNLGENIVCTHVFAILLFAKSMTQPFVSCQCKIPQNACLKDCKNPTYLGLYCSPSARGKFYLETAAIAP